MKKASERLYLLGCKNVIIKGGHLQGDAIDILYDGKGFKIIEGEKISKKNPHGTGCTFSSAITAGLALGYNINEAFEKAKKYVVGAIKNSFSLGKGFDLLNHMYEFYDVN
jgi:hydroxymethylpyrimidine/phosphomethylpyrimidine kinase